MRRAGMRLVVLTFALAAALVTLAFSFAWLTIPPEWSPWAALDLDAPPNFMTRYKLSRLSRDPHLCARVLADAEMSYRPLPDEATGAACGLSTP